MNTLEEVREKAAQMEANEFNFLGPDGKLAKKRRHYVTFEVRFIDGTVMQVPRSVVESPEFDAISFKLRPNRSH